MNIILVIFDTLRKDCVGCYGSPAGWGWDVATPHFDALSAESLVMNRAYPEALPTLQARRAIYTGQKLFPFVDADYHLRGDFVGAPGWGPIPEDQDTLSEILQGAGYRTALISDLYHQFKPSKNFWRGFDQWTLLRGQEVDIQRSGPEPTEEEISKYLPAELENPVRQKFIAQCLKNMRGRDREEDYFNARVFIEAGKWLAENRDADQFFLTVESFDPHDPWFVPEYYRRMYDDSDGPEQVISSYGPMSAQLLHRTRANYSGLVTMCDRWLGHFIETMRNLGLFENTVLIVTSDHGHSIGDEGYVGKRPYPSRPEVFDVPVFVRHPQGIGAGLRSDMLIQHTDLSAQVLQFAGLKKLPADLHGQPFFDAAVAQKAGHRDHVTVAWGPNVTVIDQRWWMNCKIDGMGALLYDLAAPDPFQANLADRHPDRVKAMFAQALKDAKGDIPDYLLKLAEEDRGFQWKKL